MIIRTEVVRYRAAGLSMIGDLYIPEGVSMPLPGALVFPEGSGLNNNIRSNARKLAQQGYVVLAGDLHGDARILTEQAEMMTRLGALRENVADIRALGSGAMEALCARPEVDATRIAAMGYCFGGVMALELGRGGAPLAAIVGFHSGLGTLAPQDARNIKGKVLVCIGADDPVIPPEQRLAFEEEMRAGGVDWRMNLYGGVVHSFTNPATVGQHRPQFAFYNEAADRHSWDEMSALFAEVLR